MKRNYSHLTIILTLLALLSGCQPAGPDASFELYLERLGNTLELELTLVQPHYTARPPRSGQLRLEFPRDLLDALDFLALRGCELQITIGKRNSSLGRLARDSQRLLLELEFLQLAPACISHLNNEGKQALAATLEHAWRAKRQQLPGRIFNATLAADEFREFWQPGQLHQDYPGNTSSTVISALENLNALVHRWLQGDYSFDNRDFEILLSEVARGDGGELWQAMSEQDAWLESADDLLEQKLSQGPLCSTNRRPAAADILPNVTRRFFIEGIQPRSAALGRRYHQLLPPMRALEQLLASDLPQQYRTWQQQRDAELEQQAQAPRRHVLQLQKVLAPCPGAVARLREQQLEHSPVPKVR